MSIFDKKLIHAPKLYREEKVSREFGKRVLRDLERKGLIAPDVTPNGREFISPREAEIFHKAVRA